jgi:predicted RNase H-like nuclease
VKVVGVDRCRAGWFWVALEGGGWSVGVAPSASGVWEVHRDADRILVDVPVGLPEGGSEERACDVLARELLGARGSSVFPVPCRPAVQADGPEEASRINEERTGRKLSPQSRSLIGGIREVDLLLRSEPGAREVVRETHPEVAFWGLNGGEAVRAGKRDREGLVERIAILDAHDRRAPKAVSATLLALPRNRVARHDVLDALAGAVTALRATGLRTIPDDPPLDARGLPMEMVLWTPPGTSIP